jgi:hypothetical protein
VPLTTAILKSICAPFAGDLAARGVAEAELAKIHPRGEDNPGRDVHAWLRYYGRLCALRALVDRDTPADAGAAAVADRVILEALAGSARPVALTGTRELRLAAYPKSAFALLQCHVRNLARARCLTFAERLGQSDAPDAHEMIARALGEALHQHRVLAWIACTAGPGLPFSEIDPDPALPAEYQDLAPQDLLAICREFDEVNWARLRALEALVTPDPEDTGSPRRAASWSKFLGTVAEAEGEASERVLRDRSLVGLIATKQLAASAQREAMADAKEKARPTAEDR